VSDIDLVGIRIDPRVKAALERAAATDDCRASALARRIVTHWLQAYGWLNNEKPDAAAIRSRLVMLLGP
jgi:hypothetical protein